MALVFGFWALIIFAVVSSTARGADDSDWDSSFFLLQPAATGALNVLFADNKGNFYAGGKGILALGSGRGIAKWNGREWLTLNGGLSGTRNEIHAIIGKNHEIYAGGTFTNIGGINATNLARWDGTNWWPVGGGVFGPAVRSLAFVQDELVVGGSFTNVGGELPVNGLAAWNGTAWSDMGGGVQGLSSNVSVLCYTNGLLWVGGSFSKAGGIVASNIAGWNGHTWRSFAAGGSNGVNGNVEAIVGWKNGSVVIGAKVLWGNASYAGIWNGEEWQRLPVGRSGDNGGVRGLQVYNNELYFAGGFSKAENISLSGLVKWDGTNWVFPGGPLRYPLRPSVIWNGELYLLGASSNHVMMADYEQLVAKYDGTQWTVFGAGIVPKYTGADVVNSIATFRGEPYIGGIFHTGSFNDLPDNSAVWDGTRWRRVGNGISVGETYAVAANEQAVYYGGKITSVNGELTTGIAGWNGTNWFALGPGLPGPARSVALDGAATVYAGGAFGLRKWDGAAWSDPGAGAIHAVSALAVADGVVYVGGKFTNAWGIYCTNIASWNGSQWAAVGGVDGEVKTLVTHGGKVYAGGLFSQAGGMPALGVAQWDGSVWKAVGEGFADGRNGITEVNALAVSTEGTLYAGGNFQSSGGQPLKHLAKWDGTNWTAVGGGMNYTVTALAYADSKLYVGGNFTATAGGKPMESFAIWHDVPRLKIGSMAGNLLQFSWPVGVRNYVLESNANLFDPQGWQPVVAESVTNENRVWNQGNATGGMRFFRLRRVDPPVP